jgi:hypothetical protein
VNAKRRPGAGAALADRPGEIDSQDRTGFENESQLPATVEGLPIIGADLPDWSRSVLTESQANVESKLFQWRKLIIAAPHLRPNAKLVALVVADRCGGNNECAWPSLARLEDDTSLSRNTILRAVSDLEAHGFLAVVRDPARGKARQANRYFPAWPAVMEAEWLLRRVVSGSPTALPGSRVAPPSSPVEPPSGSTTAPEVSLEVTNQSPSSSAPDLETKISIPDLWQREDELRQTRKGRAAARFSDHFDSSSFTFWDALAVIENFESDLDLNYGIEPVIHKALERAQRPGYVINALEMAAGRKRGAA